MTVGETEGVRATDRVRTLRFIAIAAYIAALVTIVAKWGVPTSRIQLMSIVMAGGPLGKTKKIGKDGISDIRNRMTGFIVVKAESLEAAAKFFEGHPHFTIFPGDSVEVMECLPTPSAP